MDKRAQSQTSQKVTGGCSKEVASLLNKEDDLEFPPLPTRSRPQALAVKPASTMFTSNTCLKQSKDIEKKNERGETFSLACTSSTFDSPKTQLASPSKRKIPCTRRLLETNTERENVTDPLCSDASSQSINDSMVPNKKSKMMSYREPVVLKSLDSDAFSFLSDPSRSFNDSFLSDGEHSTPTISPTASTPVYSNNNLGSLTDFIQQYDNATLNSLTDFDSPVHDMSKAQVNLFTISSSSLSPPSNSTSAPVCKSKTVYPTELSQHNTTNNKPDHIQNTSLQTEEKKEPHKGSSKKIVQKEDQTLPPLEHMPQTQQPAANAGVSPGNPLQTVEVSKAAQIHVCSCDADHTVLASEYDMPDGEKNLKDIKSRPCKKNPGHKSFHLPSELKVKDLPLEIQHEDSVTFFNCLSQLVVRITVNTTSSARGPDDMYSSYIGTASKRNGSGFIASVDEHLTKLRCKRPDCNGSDNPDPSESRTVLFEDSGVFLSPPPLDRCLSNISTASSSSSGSSDGNNKHFYYGGVFINTNKHVIFDKSEAESAHVHFFYNTPDKKDVFYGHVSSISAVKPDQDRVTLHVMSHNRELFKCIKMHLENARSSYKQMLRSTHVSQQVHGYGKKHSWAVIISHPHGLAKTITCGRVQCEMIEDSCVVKYYDAATCPGSSGGLVTTPSLLQLQWPGAVHSCTDAATGFNVTFDSRVPDLEGKVISRLHKPLIGRKDSAPENIFSLQ